MRARPVILLVGAIAIAAAPSAPAQSTRLAGASIERFAGTGLTAVNFRSTEVTPGRVGLDLAIGFVPRLLAARTLLMDVDAGFAYAARVGPGTLLLKGGPATFFGVGEVHDVYLGLQAGLAAAVPIERGCHLRLDLSRRVYFLPAESPASLWNFGIGLAVGFTR